MRPCASMLGLPASLLLLITAQANGAHAQAQRLPTAIRKMSLDGGEKFFHEYYAFDDRDDFPAQMGLGLQARGGLLSAEEERLLEANSSASIPFRPPFAPHFGATGLDDESTATGGRELFRRSKEVMGRLQRRQYACPSGTASCDAIGYPNSCCQTGLVCTVITDTGLGPVGCCPQGDFACAGSIACGASQESCPSEIGGGCCIEGYVCAIVGCVKNETATATVIPPTTSTFASTTTTTTTTSQKTSTTSTSTSTIASSSSISASTTTSGPGAPVRPTLTTTTSSTGTDSFNCPTGYYPCSALALPGCCQMGRDCQSTSCPAPTVSTTIVSSGVTVVVPVSAVSSVTTTGTCATGWFICPSEAGPTAGCCPSGYSCGTASCTLVTATATATVGKELPGSGAMRKGDDVAWMILMSIPAVLGFGLGFRMI